jgi:hypothetical protein
MYDHRKKKLTKAVMDRNDDAILPFDPLRHRQHEHAVLKHA